MSWRSFLFAADTLRLEENVGFHVETAPGVSHPRTPSPQEVREQNARSMQQLMGIMGGVKR